MSAVISVAFFFNLIALLGNFVTYVTPWQWVSDGDDVVNEGYWGYCLNGKDCIWLFNNGFELLKTRPGW